MTSYKSTEEKFLIQNKQYANVIYWTEPILEEEISIDWARNKETSPFTCLSVLTIPGNWSLLCTKESLLESQDIWDVGDQSLYGVQDEVPIHCTISLAPKLPGFENKSMRKSNKGNKILFSNSQFI